MHTDMVRMYSGSKISKKKNLHRQQPQFAACRVGGFSQQLNPDRTIRINKLKMQLTQYLQKKTVNGNLYNLRQTKSQSLAENNKSSNSKLHTSFGKELNHYRDKKKMKKNYRRHSYFQHYSEMDNGNQDMHKMSFTIKQIRPQVKQRMKRDKKIFTPGIGNTFGSYYQIVAVQKNFERSQYFQGDQSQHFLGPTSNYLNNKYISRIKNLQGIGSRKRNAMNQLETGRLQPWGKIQESIADFQ